ncbi:hypothetical protein [Streptosporangium sp. NBC_01469]|uniref:hypothetical protein n=1 Tax=Streptosporangium sp. NBC_01469 TaxID=2903898 RepID=UPI002E2BA5F4|nr:hypothetical protein [Streptosporangium sp. NBC_01469]
MGTMEETPDSAAATYEDLMRQTRRIYRELERHDGLTRRQLEQEWKTVEAAIYVVLDTTDDESDKVAGQAALDAAQQIRARWIPDADDLP